MTTNQDVPYQRAYEALLEKHGNDRAIINMMFRDGQKQFDLRVEQAAELDEVVAELMILRLSDALLRGKLAEYEAMDHLGEEPF